jgi:hypothetical protein
MFKNTNNMYKKNWKKIKLNYVNSRLIPRVDGVYIILEVKKWVHNIPLGLKIIYIGKGKIRNRFLDHISILREHNIKLANNIINKKLEFWFIETSITEMDEIETSLIEEVSIFDQDLTNILKRKTHKIGENNHAR